MDVRISKINEIYNKIDCEPGIAKEIDSFFSFKVPNYQFMPLYKSGGWDGSVHLFSIQNRLLYAGLTQYVEKFCQEREYDIEYKSDFSDDSFSEEEIKSFISSLGLPFSPRDYQIDAFIHAICKRRSLLISPTASGKSLIIYLITRYLNSRTLLIVPTTSLIHQMYSDFESYGFDSKSNCHKIYSGEDKNENKMVTVATWQSIYKLPKAWFRKFDVVIGDECLHPDTYINMADGSKKKIKDVRVGDLVTSFNEVSRVIESKHVIKVHRNISIDEQMYEVKISNGASIKITGNHKVLLVTGEWKRADRLEVGDIINSIEHISS